MEPKEMGQGGELQDLLGYQLQLARTVAIEDIRVRLEPFGITPPKLTALLLIRDNPGCGQTWLGNALNVNRSSAMKIVNTLVDRGLVERRAGKDLRSNALHLSESGQQEIGAMIDAAREADAQMTARLTPEDRATLLRLLTVVVSTGVSSAG